MIENTKTRTFVIEGLSKTSDEIQLRKAMLGVPGIKAAEWEDKGRLCIQYDLCHVRRRQIEEEIVKCGFRLANNILARWIRGFVDFTEDNEYSNMTETPRPCCSDPFGNTRPSHRKR